MKKSKFLHLALSVLLLLLIFSVTACNNESNAGESTDAEGHSHEWKEATCITPKTCSTCSATEGEALGHIWKDASCSAPKTCITCSATEGETLAHTFQDATCTKPKTCSVCSTTEGTALGHDWKEATCTTPKTCTICKSTSGTSNPENHSGTETCSICKKNYKQTLVNYVFDNGEQKYSEYFDENNNYVKRAYWRLEYNIYIDNNLCTLIFTYNPDADYLSVELQKGSGTKTYVGLRINYSSYNYDFSYTTFPKSGIGDFVNGTMSAKSFSLTTNSLVATDIDCYDGYHTDEYLSQQTATYMKQLLASLDTFCTKKGLGINISHLGFTNYKWK